MEKPIQRGRRVCGIVTYFTRLYEEEKKKKERKKRGKKLPAISTRSWILCSEQNIVRARDDNISGKWVNGVVIYIYIYIFRKFERKLPSISVEIGFEKKRPWENLFYGGIGKKKKKRKNCSIERNGMGRYLENANSNYYLIIFSFILACYNSIYHWNRSLFVLFIPFSFICIRIVRKDYSQSLWIKWLD